MSGDLRGGGVEALAGLPPRACVLRVGGGGTCRSPPLPDPALDAGGRRAGGREAEGTGRGVACVGGSVGGEGSGKSDRKNRLIRGRSQVYHTLSHAFLPPPPPVRPMSPGPPRQPPPPPSPLMSGGRACSGCPSPPRRAPYPHPLS